MDARTFVRGLVIDEVKAIKADGVPGFSIHPDRIIFSVYGGDDRCVGKNLFVHLFAVGTPVGVKIDKHLFGSQP